MSLRWLLILGLPIVVLVLWVLAIPQARESSQRAHSRQRQRMKRRRRTNRARRVALQRPSPRRRPLLRWSPRRARRNRARPHPAKHRRTRFPRRALKDWSTNTKPATRASRATQLRSWRETAVQAAFQSPDVPPGLLKSVLCHQTVCKIEVHWSAHHEPGYMGAMMRVVGTSRSEDRSRVAGRARRERQRRSSTCT